MIGNQLINLGAIIVLAIVEAPLIMIPLGAAVNILAWHHWANPNMPRKYCTQLWMGTFDAWNTKKMFKYKQLKLAEKDKKKPNLNKINSSVENFFISRIGRAEIGSLGQHIWGGFYKTFCLLISQYRQDWIRFLMLMLPILCFLCYMQGSVKNIIFAMSGLMVIYMNLWIHSSLLVTSGRKQRFYSTLTIAAVTTIWATVLVTSFAIITQLLATVMPPLTVKGHELIFDALNINYSVTPLVMMPLMFTINLFCYKKPMLAMFLAMIIFQLFFISSIVGTLTIMNRHIQITPLHMIIMIPFAWAIFIATLRYICMRTCLTK